MNIGILGSGTVAQTLGAKLVEVGHDVVLGTRDPGKLNAWVEQVEVRGEQLRMLRRRRMARL